jgi:hypothetical protein
MEHLTEEELKKQKKREQSRIRQNRYYHNNIEKQREYIKTYMRTVYTLAKQQKQLLKEQSTNI